MNPLSSHDLQDISERIAQIAEQAGQITLDYFGSPITVEHKADQSPVTRADREAEQMIRKALHNSYPEFGVLGEEFGYEPGKLPYTWIIDPIDGTKSFVAGVPLYTVLIALLEDTWDGAGTPASEKIVAGVIHAPAAGESVYASRGNGAIWLGNGRRRPARVSQTTSIANARVTTTDWADLARRAPQLFDKICESGSLTRTWGDAYGYLLVATGRADLMIDPIMSPWDLGPLPVVVSESGGVFSTIDGHQRLGDSALATTPGIAKVLFGADAAN